MALDFGSFNYALVAIASITAIMNPISTAAVYTALTEDLTDENRRNIIRESMQIGLFVLFFFAITGQVIFFLFGLTLPAFKIAGGILLMSFAIGMLYPKKVIYSPEELENIAIVPLAFPLTCGAGTITTVILLASEASSIVETLIVYLAIIVAIGLSYILMTYSALIFKYIGEHEVRVIVRLLSIFVLAIAVQFLISGITDAIIEVYNSLP
jgi:multiple antibiotic resistance protein